MYHFFMSNGFFLQIAGRNRKEDDGEGEGGEEEERPTKRNRRSKK